MPRALHASNCYCWGWSVETVEWLQATQLMANAWATLIPSSAPILCSPIVGLRHIPMPAQGKTPHDVLWRAPAFAEVVWGWVSGASCHAGLHSSSQCTGGAFRKLGPNPIGEKTISPLKHAWGMGWLQHLFWKMVLFHPPVEYWSNRILWPLLQLSV